MGRRPLTCLRPNVTDGSLEHHLATTQTALHQYKAQEPSEESAVTQMALHQHKAQEPSQGVGTHSDEDLVLIEPAELCGSCLRNAASVHEPFPLCEDCSESFRVGLPWQRNIADDDPLDNAEDLLGTDLTEGEVPESEEHSGSGRLLTEPSNFITSPHATGPTRGSVFDSMD